MPLSASPLYIPRAQLDRRWTGKGRPTGLTWSAHPYSLSPIPVRGTQRRVPVCTIEINVSIADPDPLSSLYSEDSYWVFYELRNMGGSLSPLFCHGQTYHQRMCRAAILYYRQTTYICALRGDLEAINRRFRMASKRIYGTWPPQLFVLSNRQSYRIGVVSVCQPPLLLGIQTVAAVITLCRWHVMAKTPSVYHQNLSPCGRHK
ncbi:hypothetical protein ARMSODRAFT_777084 [Armillaria solidipes]|uniref:Uncharacterized protein n=1 Tax=Armillaria solidipes TaxID=1076256 RepID=A0A2H3AXJ3_9AGAR|nr:hypothetical protein ARMSODRAFT_777084 [Armillaria solidipes]